MRLLGILLSVSAALSGCATSEQGVGGGVGGSLPDGSVGGAGGVAGSSSGGSPGGGGLGGLGGSSGSATGGVSGSSTGGVAGSTTGGGGGTGGTGATGGGGTGGAGCTPPVAGGLCDTTPQCGCPAGQACDVANFAGITQCVQAGNVPPYNACDGATTKCQAGYACVGGACKLFCESVADCTGPAGDCSQVTYTDTSGNPQPIPQMKICAKKCKLESPSADCGATLSCYLTDQTAGKTDCAAAGTGIGAVNCTTNNSICAPGYVCLTSGECRKWCRVGTTADCAAGKACTGFAAPNQIFIGTTEYGVCAL